LGYFNNPARLLDPGFCIRKLADLDMTDVRWSGPVERGGLLALASDFMEAVVESVFEAPCVRTEEFWYRPLRRHVFGHVFSAVVPGMVCVDAFPVVAPQSHVFARGDANHPLSNAHCDGDPVFMRDASERGHIPCERVAIVSPSNLLAGLAFRAPETGRTSPRPRTPRRPPSASTYLCRSHL
jgi:hypothetical protein